MAPILLQMASQGNLSSSTTVDSHILTLKGVTVFSNGVLPKNAEPPSIMSALAGGQTTNENLMAAAIDWAEKQKESEKWAHLDTTRIAAAGQSCGGLEAQVMTLDKRVKTIGIFNSGSSIGKGKGGKGGLPLPNKGTVPTGSSFNVPAFFFLGGTGDVASAKVRQRPHDPRPC
jgi:hypothetical protein